MRGDGRIFQRKGSAHYWIAYCHRGQEIRESSKSPDFKVAEKLLRRRLKEIGADQLGFKAFVGPAQERVTFKDLADVYLQDYAVRGLRSKETAEARVMHLRAFFGLDRAVDITPTRIRAYQAGRLEEGAEGATVNREVAALARMFHLAVKAGRLSACPVFPERLEENPPRQGFFEHAEYLAIRAHLAPDYQDVLDFAYHAGWRKREILRLEWREVDLPGGVIRLDPARSKTKKGRVLPLSPPLREILVRRAALRRLDTPLVFHTRKGQPVGDWRKSWYAACQAAGFWTGGTRDEKTGKIVGGEPTRTLHDCRRTVARNLVRAGTPERVAMRITGHLSRDVFDRYNIVSDGDLVEAGARLAAYLDRQEARPAVIPLTVAAGEAR